MSSETRSLAPATVREAHERIKQHIHLTPVLTSHTLSELASSANPPGSEGGIDDKGPRINLFFKCENYQRIGAFKARGAFHALSRLTPEELRKGIVTHSSGNHAQALALAARTHGIPAYVVMPTISAPSKIAATKGYGAEVLFSGSTHPERQAVTDEVIARTGATFVPPYDHVDIILGQGTTALEFKDQVEELLSSSSSSSSAPLSRPGSRGLDAVITPCGGGGLLSGCATALSGTGIRVFGAEPSFEGADDCARGLAQGARIEHVNTHTIADGLRTPVGEIPWRVISDKSKVQGVYAVSDAQILDAMRLLVERAKIFVEPSAAVGLAVVLYNEEFREMVRREAGEEGWNVGIVLSGGNTTLEAISGLFGGAPRE